ncbi:MAG TPA: hypothetical protein VJX67_24110 [Blastocatellia bacterium]|nr:hypothetical protein [Blastocatellia bacterium]
MKMMSNRDRRISQIGRPSSGPAASRQMGGGVAWRRFYGFFSFSSTIGAGGAVD